MLTGSFTFVAMTYNLWGDWELEQREPAIRDLFTTRPPDLLATQELRPRSRAVLDEAMPGHARVHDDFPGWGTQSNLWWREELFDLVEYGAADVGILAPDARLFWVRLRPRIDGARPLVFATAHLTWPGHEREREDRRNLRTGQAEQVAAALDELAGDGVCLFTVDINDIGQPLWVLGNSGFLDSFTALGRTSPVTHPVSPLPFVTERGTRLSPLGSPSKAIDWIFAKGPIATRASEVVDFFSAGTAPSDHKPVAATFTLPSVTA
ncbi:endonuclease/exonuclease/phosphatase family protein [Nonomuraea fuscirosea]|uniref:endonuclease/exonuclease/phosphatase family protein n=1 Tax=Nonomuraea fuscirosea TaxID=1291556 RepID=UPI00371220F4